jgi:Polysaccharide deacetylase
MDESKTSVPGGWPGGARSAAALTFDFDAEEVWLAEDPANASRPGVLSQGTYGARVGVPLILQILERRAIHATFFVPGRVAERYPDVVRAIVGAGHELAHHGYTHTSPTALSPQAEEDELTRGLEILSSFGGPVTGYRSPAWEFSEHTLALLARHGFGYSSNLAPTAMVLPGSSNCRFTGRSTTRRTSRSAGQAGPRRSRRSMRCGPSGRTSWRGCISSAGAPFSPCTPR